MATLSPLRRLCLAHDPPITTNAELARLVGRDKSAITRLEQGDGGELLRRRVSEVFGLSLDKFDAHMAERVDLVKVAQIRSAEKAA